MIDFYSLTYEQLQGTLVALGMTKAKAKILYNEMYRNRLVAFDDTDKLSPKTIELLNKSFALTKLDVVEQQISEDGTQKLLLQLGDGNMVEIVLMQFEYGVTLCVTSQVGCNMGCCFCASGLLKKVRNLTADEMVAEVLCADRIVTDMGKRITNIVIMGTGEPLDNYDNVITFCDILSNDNGMAIPPSRITISTSGLCDGIKKLAHETNKYSLAISLHASNDAMRSRIMPINRKYHFDEVIEMLDYHYAHVHRKITIEYLLLKGINDSEEALCELVDLFKDRKVNINLLNYNKVDELPFEPCSHEVAMHFYDVLMKNGLKVNIRQKKGDDIDAACGQLRAKHQSSLDA